MENLSASQASNLTTVRVEVSDRPLPIRMRLPGLYLRGLRPRRRSRLPVLTGSAGIVPLTVVIALAVRTSRMPR